MVVGFDVFGSGFSVLGPVVGPSVGRCVGTGTVVAGGIGDVVGRGTTDELPPACVAEVEKV